MRIPTLVLAIMALAILCFFTAGVSRLQHLETMKNYDAIESQILERNKE